jgi:hypothetical protein
MEKGRRKVDAFEGREMQIENNFSGARWIRRWTGNVCRGRIRTVAFSKGVGQNLRAWYFLSRGGTESNVYNDEGGPNKGRRRYIVIRKLSDKS